MEAFSCSRQRFAANAHSSPPPRRRRTFAEWSLPLLALFAVVLGACEGGGSKRSSSGLAAPSVSQELLNVVSTGKAHYVRAIDPSLRGRRRHLRTARNTSDRFLTIPPGRFQVPAAVRPLRDRNLGRGSSRPTCTAPKRTTSRR
jgi:hypothetical protein